MFLVSRSLRRSIYGFLLHDRPGALSANGKKFVVAVREWVVYGVETLGAMVEEGRPEAVTPAMPPEVRERRSRITILQRATTSFYG